MVENLLVKCPAIVTVCEDDSWCVHAASHTIDPAALLGKHNLWCCLIGTWNMAGLFGQQLCKVQVISLIIWKWDHCM